VEKKQGIAMKSMRSRRLICILYFMSIIYPSIALAHNPEGLILSLKISVVVAGCVSGLIKVFLLKRVLPPVCPVVRLAVETAGSELLVTFTILIFYLQPGAAFSIMLIPAIAFLIAVLLNYVIINHRVRPRIGILDASGFALTCPISLTASLFLGIFTSI
jgi:hypothetical protein